MPPDPASPLQPRSVSDGIRKRAAIASVGAVLVGILFAPFGDSVWAWIAAGFVIAAFVLVFVPWIVLGFWPWSIPRKDA